MLNPKVYMDISIGKFVAGNPLGRITVELFADTTPKTAATFLSLCTGEKGGKIHYKGTKFEPIGDLLCKGGHIRGLKDPQSVYGLKPEPEPIYGRNPENFIKKHNKAGIVSMVNVTGTSFFISAKPMPHLNGEHVVVGQVVEGMDVVYAIVNSPKMPFVVIADCGQLPDRVVSSISAASQKTPTTKLEQIISGFTKQFSICLKEARNFSKELTEVDSKDVLVSDNKNELVGFTGILEQNLGVLSDLKAEVCSLEKCQNELMSRAKTKITNIKNKKLVLEMMASMPDEDIVDIENELKKHKRDCH